MQGNWRKNYAVTMKNDSHFPTLFLSSLLLRFNAEAAFDGMPRIKKAAGWKSPAA